jgi:group II intron reverse transcriptase/maturase
MKAEGLVSNLTTPASVQKLQTALHDKAKEAPNFRFYALYDKVYRKDVLAFAYECCKANGGAAGVDGRTFEDIEAYGKERWSDELAQELKKRSYQPLPVRRVYIPKPDGKQRPLGVPAIRDRVAQMAAVLVLEPIFEADLQPEQYAYRKDHSALDAVRHVHKLINTGHGEIVDADLSGYFDSIPHAELLQSVARRVVDGAMLHLMKMWLETPVEETDEYGKKHRSTRNRDEGRGSPQGSPISPLLSNLYMRRFVLGWKKLGHERRLKAYIVNYADDLVICCRNRADAGRNHVRHSVVDDPAQRDSECTRNVRLFCCARSSLFRWDATTVCHLYAHRHHQLHDRDSSDRPGCQPRKLNHDVDLVAQPVRARTGGDRDRRRYPAGIRHIGYWNRDLHRQCGGKPGHGQCHGCNIRCYPDYDGVDQRRQPRDHRHL